MRTLIEVVKAAAEKAQREAGYTFPLTEANFEYDLNEMSNYKFLQAISAALEEMNHAE